MHIIKIIFAVLTCVPLAALCYYFLNKLVEQLYKNRSK